MMIVKKFFKALVDGSGVPVDLITFNKHSVGHFLKPFLTEFQKENSIKAIFKRCIYSIIALVIIEEMNINKNNYEESDRKLDSTISKIIDKLQISSANNDNKVNTKVSKDYTIVFFLKLKHC